jgi:hypothetical protein
MHNLLFICCLACRRLLVRSAQRFIRKRSYLIVILSSHIPLFLPTKVADIADFFNDCASEKQAKTQVKKWGLAKNIKKPQLLAMLSIQDKRASEGKKTTFSFKGKEVSEHNLQRGRRRYKESMEKSERGYAVSLGMSG